ncbi:alpha/beta hydrolase [Serpentinicella sp. ANB-PHB4]|uniref:intracellular short-chain-length polyhydroxyalkanoate depolymerase n=1 Tax=Serpentinicella sp. ANB-PHB4 TaxID=3074076 RepID=UPI00285B8979|nr:alpha/beta hydrolase [Serpentinicella sp. ANB-PHB4]MDR5658716.1 alpha/beta hydrolase [Serpentinicella sp. ANB-PHB4]
MSTNILKALCDVSYKSIGIYTDLYETIVHSTVPLHTQKERTKYKFNNITLKKIKLSNGETLGYRESGSGKQTLILLHGNMSSSKNWDLLMENMPGDYKVFAIDLRGFGISTYRKSIYSIKDLSEDINLFMDCIGIDKAVLVGWSAGGAVAMQFAADYSKRVEKLILLSSSSMKGYTFCHSNFLSNTLFPNFTNTPPSAYLSKHMIENDVRMFLNACYSRNKWVLKQIADLSLYNVKKPDPDRYDAYIEEMIKQQNLVDINYALIHFNISNEHNGIVNGTGEVDKITMPTLIIHGRKDKIISEEMSIATQRGIGDNAKLVYLDNSGHTPLVDELDNLIYLIIGFI